MESRYSSNLLPAYILLATCITASAQVNTATIYGVVTDPRQANVPGAQLNFKTSLPARFRLPNQTNRGSSRSTTFRWAATPYPWSTRGFNRKS